MASAVAWPSIQLHGLLSTAHLLELYSVDPRQRDEWITQPRRQSVYLQAPELPPALLRDQKPMKFVQEKIEPGHSLEDFLVAINSRVFFWPTRDRLERLRQAKEYRRENQVVIHVDTGLLIERYEDKIQLCRFNSGAITQKNHPDRSHASWIPISRYPYLEYRRTHGRGRALTEVTVLGSVPDVLELAVEVEHLPAAG